MRNYAFIYDVRARAALKSVKVLKFRNFVILYKLFFTFARLKKRRMLIGASTQRNASAMRIRKILITLAMLLVAWPMMRAQDIGIKTNLLYDALLSPNIGLEFGLAPKWSLDVSGTVDFWTVNDKRWRQWHVQPEARYWFCHRNTGSFIGLHAITGQYNFGNLNFGGYNFLGTNLKQLEDHRLQGFMAGAGIAYGYSWILDKHWNIEAELGLGWIWTRYDRFRCVGCGVRDVQDKVHNYVGPTKAAVSLIYNF